MTVESVKAAYVRGEFEVDEFERRVADALAHEGEHAPPAWLVADFQRTHAAARSSGRSMVLTGGMTWTDAPGGYLVTGSPSEQASPAGQAGVSGGALVDPGRTSRLPSAHPPRNERRPHG